MEGRSGMILSMDGEVLLEAIFSGGDGGMEMDLLFVPVPVLEIVPVDDDSGSEPATDGGDGRPLAPLPDKRAEPELEGVSSTLGGRTYICCIRCIVPDGAEP